MNREQIEWLDRCTRGRSWELNPDTGLVDIDGGFSCSSMGLTDFKGIKFGKVSGYFHCYSNQLTSLNGAPKGVGLDFVCMNNQLTSLTGSPKEVGLNFACQNNQLISLMGAPKSIGRDLYCMGNSVSERTILSIYRIMRDGKSYTEVLLQYWDQMPEEDKMLMYKDHRGLSDDETRMYELMNKVKEISI